MRILLLHDSAALCIFLRMSFHPSTFTFKHEHEYIRNEVWSERLVIKGRWKGRDSAIRRGFGSNWLLLDFVTKHNQKHCNVSIVNCDLLQIRYIIGTTIFGYFWSPLKNVSTLAGVLLPSYCFQFLEIRCWPPNFTPSSHLCLGFPILLYPAGLL